MVERIQFVCSLCKYRTFYEEEMASHLDSKFHKEHFKYVGTKLPKQTADFLQEYVTNKTKKTEELRKTVEDLDGLIQQIYRDQDLTQEIAMEHFVKKVEAAHCAACDLFIPMQFGIIQKHLKTMDHNRNRRALSRDLKPLCSRHTQTQALSPPVIMAMELGTLGQTEATRTMATAMATARITPPTTGTVRPPQTLGKCLTRTQMQTPVLRVAPVPIPFCPELTSA